MSVVASAPGEVAPAFGEALSQSGPGWILPMEIYTRSRPVSNPYAWID